MNKRIRPKMLNGITYQLATGCGQIYITINSDEFGLFELFATMGKAGGCASSNCEAIGRIVSLAWRSGIEPKQIVKTLHGISCHLPVGFGDIKILSCADAIAQAIKLNIETKMDAQHSPPLPPTPPPMREIIEGVGTVAPTGIIIPKLAPKKVFHKRGACPECGGQMKHESGCSSCTICSYSDCG